MGRQRVLLVALPISKTYGLLTVCNDTLFLAVTIVLLLTSLSFKKIDQAPPALLMKKNEAFLKFIIIEKFTLGIIAVLLSFGIISLINKDMEEFANNLVPFLNLDMDNHYIEALIDRIGMIETGTIIGVSIGMVSYASLNLAMGYGLYRRRRWAEWLTVIATSLLIPFEIYEIIREQTALRIGILILNIAIVYYLAKHKELFSRKKKCLI